MSSRQAVVLASRVLCVFLIFWSVVNLINLPVDILGLHQHSSVLIMGSDPVFDRYWVRYYWLRTETAILLSILELFFASVLYRCGPRVVNFFTAETMSPESAENNPTA